MIAILHYLSLKTFRDRSAVTLLLFPAVALGAPLLVVAAFELIRGRGVYPLTFDSRIPPKAMAEMLMTSGSMGSVFVAGLAAFWFLRSEVANRSIGSLVLATRPFLVALSSALYGATVGFMAFLLVICNTKILIGQIVPDWRAMMLVTAGCSLVAGALGFVALTISSDTSMLVPVMASTMFLMGSGREVGAPAPQVVAWSIAAFPILLLFASALLERRCAA